MVRLEIYRFSRAIIPEDEAFDAYVQQTLGGAIPLEITEFPGPIAITNVHRHDNPEDAAVGIFVPDEKDAWAAMSPFQKTTGNILRLYPMSAGEMTVDGNPIPVGGSMTIQGDCTIYVHYDNGEGGWR